MSVTRHIKSATLANGKARGREALDVTRLHGDPIDLLVADLVLPEMGGQQVAELACAYRPDLKVLFISGPAANDGITGANSYTFRSGRQTYQDILAAK